MSCWYYSNEDIEHRTPSREDGLSLSAETRYRRDGARFIINASNTLGLRYETPATGVVFFHRFFMIQSFKQFNRWVVAAACLLLAGKVEETPKKCKDVLKVTESLLTERQMAKNFGSNAREELLTHERILLQTINFDLQVQHPYSYLLKFAKSLKGDKQKMEKLVQTAWTFVNDSLSTVLCLQWEPQAIAVAFLYLAGKLAKYDLQSITQSKSRSWWRQFVDTLDIHDLDTICHQVLDTYGEAADSSSNSQDEDENDTHQLTPHQTPPSTASIPPSLSVPATGGVGHTVSSHLPPPLAPLSVPPPQLLTQPTPHSLAQQLPSPQLLSSLPQPANFTTTTLARNTPPRVGASFPGIMLNRTAIRTLGLPTQSVLPNNPGNSSQHVGFTTLNTPSLNQQLGQPHNLLQQVHLQRGVSTTGGSDSTSPPAKRHAMELSYRPGVPQHIHQLSTETLTQASYPHQLNTQTAGSRLFSGPQTVGLTLPPPPPLPSPSSVQLRPMGPSMVHGGFPVDRRATGAGAVPGAWQPK